MNHTQPSGNFGALLSGLIRIMRTRPYNHLWLLLALLLAGQSLLPASALAFVEMRCLNAPASAPACARVAVPVSGTSFACSQRVSMANCAEMPCCRARKMLPTPRRAALSAPTCLLSITPAVGERATLAPGHARWLLDAAPSLAPPASRAAAVVLLSPRSRRSLPAPGLFARLFSHLHGLRAPPVG